MTAIVEQFLIDTYKMPASEAKKVSEAVDAIDILKKNLQIKDESKYLATKEDIANLRTEIANVKTTLTEDISNVEVRLTKDIANVRTQIYIVAIGTSGFLGGLMTLFKFLH